MSENRDLRLVVVLPFAAVLAGGVALAATADQVRQLTEAVGRVDEVPRLREGTLLLFQDLEFEEAVVLDRRDDARGPMLALCDRIRRRPGVRVALLMPHDRVPKQLSGIFELVRLTPPQRETPVLDSLGLDLTRQARSGGRAPIIGNEAEIEQILVGLNVVQGQPNNVLLVGEAGVGKTALAEEVSRRIALGEVPERLRGRRLIQLRGNDLVADSGIVGRLEARIRDVIDEVRRNRDTIILFIDEIHALFTQGGRAAPIVQAFKEGWARGDLPTIGATTTAEVRVLEGDAAVASRFRRVNVPRPGPDPVLSVIREYGRREIEPRHNLGVEEATYACVRDCAERYLGQEAPPDPPSACWRPPPPGPSWRSGRAWTRRPSCGRSRPSPASPSASRTTRSGIGWAGSRRRWPGRSTARRRRSGRSRP